MQIMMIRTSVVTWKVSTPPFEEEVNEAPEEFEKEEESIFPLVGESLFDFLPKKTKGWEKGYVMSSL